MDQHLVRTGRQRIAAAMCAIFVAVIAAGAMTVSLPSAEAHAAVAQPRAVVIVGPSGSSTSDFLNEGELFADQAAAAGMEVTRIFHPRATWARARPALQGANLVVYFGHGNGWPSPYAPFQENTKNGFGLNGYEGAPAGSHVYYGGNKIRDDVRLAEDAVVIIYRSCYAAGNGEEGSPVPTRSIALERADNFAAAFLHRDVGAGVVMAFRTKQYVNLAAKLMTPGLSMEDIFRTRSSNSWAGNGGWIGTDHVYAESERTNGARQLLDPLPSTGYSRAISGDLELTTDEWRGGDSLPDAPAPTGALAISASDETPARGQTLTFEIDSSVPLTAAPTLRIKQSGHAAYVVSTTWAKLDLYRVTVTLESGGSAGQLKLKALGTPVAGEAIKAVRILPLY